MCHIAYRGPPTAILMTAICYGLAGIILCSFHVSCFISKGNFAITGEEYSKYWTRFWSGDYILNNYPIPNGVNPAVFCQRLCLRYQNCRSFVVGQNVRCSLAKVNLCTASRYVLDNSEGFEIQYDMRDGNSSEPWRGTCFKSCLATKTCEACGRGINCRGPLCQDCVSFCWELNPLQNPKMYWFVNPSIYPNVQYISVWCDQEWQKIWAAGYTTINAYHILQEQSSVLKLRMKIFYENFEEKDSYFTGVEIWSNALGIERMEPKGDAQVNNWNAPFSQRTLLTPFDTDCLPFFYDVDPCPTNDTYDSPRFVWPVDDVTYDALRITDIELWVTLV